MRRRKIMATNPATPRGRGDTDAPHFSPVTPAEDVRTVLINRISWGAVLAGVVVALVAQLLLNMLGIGVGAATLDPKTGDGPGVGTFSLMAAIWWAVAGIIAAFLGGLAAGRLSGRPKESTAGWHGLIAWALTTIVVFSVLTASIGSIIGGTLNTLGGLVGGAGRTAVEVAAPAVANAPDPFAAIERKVREASGGSDPAAMRDAAVTAVRAALTGDQAQAQQARERAAEVLAKAQNISVDEARAQVSQYEQEYRQTVERVKQQATEAADVAARAASLGALVGFIALVAGAIAAWLGGRMGAVDPTITDRGLAPATSAGLAE
jgi:hypothetical protein